MLDKKIEEVIRYLKTFIVTDIFHRVLTIFQILQTRNIEMTFALFYSFNA